MLKVILLLLLLLVVGLHLDLLLVLLLKVLLLHLEHEVVEHADCMQAIALATVFTKHNITK